MIRRAFPLYLLALVIAGCTGSAVRESTAEKIPAEGMDFKIALAKGDTYGYKMSMAMDGTAPAGTPGGTALSMKIDIDQQCKVTEVKDGNMTIEVKNTNVNVTGPQAADIKKTLEATASKVVIDSHGRVISQEGTLDAEGGSAGIIYFPDKKIKPGDTWEKKSPGPNGQSILATYKFEAVHVLDGKSVARISMTPKADVENVKLEGRTDFFVDIDTGMIAKADGKMKTTAMGQTVNTTIAISKL